MYYTICFFISQIIFESLRIQVYCTSIKPTFQAGTNRISLTWLYALPCSIFLPWTSNNLHSQNTNPFQKYMLKDLENTCQPFHLAVHNSKYRHSFFVKALQFLRISNLHLSLIVLNWHLYPFRQVSKVTSCRHMLLNQDHQYHESALIFSFIREICLYWRISYLLGIIMPKK